MNKLIFSLFSVCILFTSCHALVEDEFPDFAKVPVMNGLLQADSTFKVQVSLTANLTDTAPTYVSNARVIIESTIATPDTLVYTEKGWYVSARTAKAGASYTCRAEIPDFPTISAQTTIPMPTVIDSISYTDLVGRDEEADKISSLEFRIRNDINTKRFWFVNLKIKGIGTDYDWETREWIEGLIVREKYFYMQAGQDTVLLNEANPLEIFSNIKMKNELYWVKTYFNEHSGSGIGRNDTLMVELLNIDESYYRYMKQYYIYESAGYPSIGQSNQKYPMYSNVKNGLGLFTGMSVSRKEIAVKELAPNP
jgi:hypothetical protein